MSEDLQAIFDERARSDQSLLVKSMNANTSLSTLLTSLEGLKGKGYQVEVGKMMSTPLEQDGVEYKAPVVSKNITIQSADDKSSSLTVSLNVNGEYSFSVQGSAESKFEDTTVANQATNNVQQWILNVQGDFGIDVLATAMARQSERAEAKTTQRAKPS